jgi:hypothetical protein
MIDKKISIKKNIRETNNNKKIRTKVDIKIKLYQILRDEIKKFKTKYTTIKNFRTKFDIINK